jgi:hypothetical protein
MVRKHAVTLDSLAALGAEKLARIVLQEAGENSAFKRRVDACLAAAKGPHALAAIVDRKLLSLEKTKGQIGFGKARAFAADLNVTVRIIVDELGSIFACRCGNESSALRRNPRMHIASNRR